MLDVEPVIVGELGRLSPLDLEQRGDWAAVLVAAAPRRRRRAVAVRAGIVVAAALAVAVPAVAFSSGVPGWLGLDSPIPRFHQARLVTSAPLPGGHVARLWTAPATQGDTCWFVSYARAGSRPRPTEMFIGHLGCTRGGAKAPDLIVSISTLNTTPVLSGRVDPALRPTRVVLHWRGGSKTVPTHDGYFGASDAILNDPEFTQLPVGLRAVDSAGTTVASSHITSDRLYRHWKRVQPGLRRYRTAHGCSTTGNLWRCRDR